MTNLERDIATFIMENSKTYYRLNHYPMAIVLSAVIKAIEVNKGITLKRACDVAERNIKNYALAIAS